jgi:1-acyl-sn-glycerol-3-phosphate acyltransferase
MTEAPRPNEYHSPATLKTSWGYRLPGRSLLFAAEVFTRVVWPAWRLARRGSYDVKSGEASAWRTIRTIEKTGTPVHVTGMEVLSELAGPCVFVANHMSTIETFMFPALVASVKPLSFVVKESLCRGFFGPIMRTYHPIGVSREDPRADLKMVLSEGQKRLADGLSVFIFPQATRSLVFESAHFNSLGEKLAGRAGVPVVPVAVKTDFYAPGRIVRDLGRVKKGETVKVHFGPAMATDQPAKALHEEVVGFITTHLKEWGVACR